MLGVCLIVAAALETPAVLGILDRATVSVRPATPEEAPSAAHAGHTLVGRPDNTPSALPLLQTLGLRLLLLGEDLHVVDEEHVVGAVRLLETLDAAFVRDGVAEDVGEALDRHVLALERRVGVGDGVGDRLDEMRFGEAGVGGGGRVVKETDKGASASRASNRRTSVVVPAPEGAATT